MEELTVIIHKEERTIWTIFIVGQNKSVTKGLETHS
jgi:hypothetical protein